MLSHFSAILILCAITSSVSAEFFQQSVDSFRTDQGIVTKKQIGEPEDYGNSSIQILLDKEIIFEEKEHPFVYLHGFFTLNVSTLIVVSLTDGGNACPAFYKIIDVKKKNDIVVTEKFGTCSDLISAKLKNNRLQITMPAMHQDNPSGNWEYYQRKLFDKNKETINVSENKTTDLFYNKEEHNTIAGNFSLETRDIKVGQTHISLRVNNELILKEYNFKLGFIKYSYPMDGKSRFLVITLSDKNDGCDERFRILEFNLTGINFMSPEFGNCGSWSSFGYEDGGITASFNKTGTKPYEKYLFKNGKLKQVK
ncbi:MAG: hypothetical protein OEZ58_23360 [Gammaproteobacteria bacterium]|nr:hypothetical protein [Gammaproteobacteria bacterium]